MINQKWFKIVNDNAKYAGVTDWNGPKWPTHHITLEQMFVRGERSSGKFHKQTKENFISRESIKLLLNIFLNFKPISGQVDRHTDFDCPP